ncbi:hypothetical protein DLD77_06105 [Chitinophaga alhagiae]|uniref:Uncharacterized protein n=1 Tax=Chitinophaga alhagiae TaxID=2203219 RepID=A0ABN5LTH8_9BACT|nr:hypothetical protein DLD77_06105 [Chitinophaga alhagiae]
MFLILTILALLLPCSELLAQCSLCTKTAQQLGEGPAKGLNNGILMLAFTPLALMAFLGYRWWRSQKAQ